MADAFACSTISNQGSRVGAAIAFGMPRNGRVALAARRWLSENYAASAATMGNCGQRSTRQSRAACGGGLTRGIVRRWRGLSESWAIDLNGRYLSASLTASMPACAHVSSWSPVPPLTPIPPICTRRMSKFPDLAAARRGSSGKRRRRTLGGWRDTRRQLLMTRLYGPTVLCKRTLMSRW